MIHPESQDNVEETRDRLREANRLPNGAAAAEEANDEAICPICFSQATHAIETNCAHRYCGNSSKIWVHLILHLSITFSIISVYIRLN